MQKDLEKLGLSTNETVIYLTLLELGESPSGIIIKRVSKHRNIVYEALDSLIQNKLVIETIKKGKKYFKIANPEILVTRAQDRLNLAEELVKEIKNKIKIKAPQVIIYEGQDGWQTAYRRIMKSLKKGDKIYALGAGADKWIQAIGDLFLTYEKFLQQNQIILSMVAYEWQRKEIQKHQKNFARTTRYLKEQYLVPANTEIFKDRIFIQIYTSPLILIEIKNRQVADGYLQHFKTLWKIAKK